MYSCIEKLAAHATSLSAGLASASLRGSSAQAFPTWVFVAGPALLDDSYVKADISYVKLYNSYVNPDFSYVTLDFYNQDSADKEKAVPFLNEERNVMISQ